MNGFCRFVRGLKLQICFWGFGVWFMMQGPCVAVARASTVFPLHTAGAYIVDAKGQRVRLNAVNWYGAESTDYVVAGLQTVPLPGIVQEIKHLGFNAVRLPWSNQMYEGNPVVSPAVVAANPGMAGKHALDVFDQVIAALTQAGIMVILDNHNSNAEWCCGNDGNTLWYNEAYPQSSWIRDWKGIVTRYKGNAMVAGADLRNEPRLKASWGGEAATNWQAAAEQGGNAVLSVNPKLLIFVEGVNYSLDLSGVSQLPIHLQVAHRLVYEAHDYGYDYAGLTGYEDYAKRVTHNWGYLVTGSNPQPVWVGEFGTCNSAANCVSSSQASDNGYWFQFLSKYIQTHGLDWCYWAVNGTQSTGSGRSYGAAEGYGILNRSWTASALEPLTIQLQHLMRNAPLEAGVRSGQQKGARR